MNKAAQIGVGFVGLGFLALFIAWNGAAGQDCPECQIPYLISGGAVGLGLIGVGAALLLFESGRRDRAHLDAKLEELRLTFERFAVPNSNGSAHPISPAAPTAPVPAVINIDPSLVVLGRSSFHSQDCRLVTGKDDLVFGTRSDAADGGLEPCRVCEPNKSTKTASKKR